MTPRFRGRAIDVQRVAVAMIGLVVGAVAVYVAGEVRYAMWQLGEGAGGRSSDAEISEAREALLGRTTFDEVEGTAPAVLDRILRSLDEELGTVAWALGPVDHGTSGCTPTEGEVVRTPHRDGDLSELSEAASATGSVRLDADQAVRAADIVAEVGRQHGYAGADGNRNGSGIEHVDLKTVRGGTISGRVSVDQVSVRVVTDCFLPAALLAELS